MKFYWCKKVDFFQQKYFAGSLPLAYPEKQNYKRRHRIAIGAVKMKGRLKQMQQKKTKNYVFNKVIPQTTDQWSTINNWSTINGHPIDDFFRQGKVLQEACPRVLKNIPITCGSVDALTFTIVRKSGVKVAQEGDIAILWSSIQRSPLLRQKYHVRSRNTKPNTKIKKASLKRTDASQLTAKITKDNHW